MREPEYGPEESELIARLLRLAGPRHEAPAGVRERVRRAVHARWLERTGVKRRRRRLVWLTGSLAAAAAVASVVMLGGGLLRVTPPPAAGPAATVVVSVGPLRAGDGAALSPGSAIAPGTVLSTGGDVRAALHLADGASVRLDAGTRVVVRDGSTVRLEKGRVYVDSGMASDPSRQLEVRTGFGVLHDVGTQFEVSVRDDGMQVRVRQGVVRLDRDDRSHEVRSGAQLAVDGRGGLTWGTVPPYGDAWNWILDAAPGFELEGSTLESFLGWVSSETGLTIAFTDDDVRRDAGRIILHGSVAGVRPDQAPDAVLPTCGLEYRIVGDSLLIGPAGAGGDSNETR